MSTERTDTDRLNWLLKMGYIAELRLFGVSSWIFYTDDSVYGGKSAREAIDAAIDAEDAQ